MKWKNIDGYEGKYQVNKKGQIKFLGDKFHKENILKPYRKYGNYDSVQLGKNGKRMYVHRIVAETFCILPKLQVNHKDGNKENNNADNLEWVTCKENINHALVNKLKIPFKGEKHWASKLKEDDVRQIIQERKNGMKLIEIAKKHNVSIGCVSEITMGRNWKCLQEVIK